ncbi:hypothetical protein NC652_017274 [Populus alba x Populus x berolinensis]|nr:hypothetical protein NC652_017274 [Populus alba x Populus x berolinensis]
MMTFKDGAVPAFLLDRENTTRSKQQQYKAKEEREGWKMGVSPLPKVRAVAEDEMFKPRQWNRRVPRRPHLLGLQVLQENHPSMSVLIRPTGNYAQVTNNTEE